MKLRLTLSQLKRILQREHLKLPVSFTKGNLTDQELEELLQVLQQAESRG